MTVPLSGVWYGGIISKPVGAYNGLGAVGTQSEKEETDRRSTNRKTALESSYYKGHIEKWFILFISLAHKGIGNPPFEPHFLNL